MTTHSSILAQKIPWTKKPGGYSPWGGKELGMSENHGNDGKRRYLYQHPLHLFPILERQREMEKMVFLYTTINTISIKPLLDIV